MAALILALFSFQVSALTELENLPAETVRVENVRVCQSKNIKVYQQLASGLERVVVEEAGEPTKTFTSCRRVDDRRAVMFDCAALGGSSEDIFLVMDKTDKSASMNGYSLTCI